MSALATIAAVAWPCFSTAVAPPADRDGRPWLREVEEAAGAEASEPQSRKSQIVEAWRSALLNAEYLRYDLNVERSSRAVSDEERLAPSHHLELLNAYDGSLPGLTEEERKSFEENKLALHVEVVMGSESIFMQVWERDEAGAYDRELPIVTLAFHDGRVRERIWYPVMDQYRTAVYDSMTPWGPEILKTAFDKSKGCMFGASLSTWVGDSYMNQTFTATLLASELAERRVELDERTRYRFRRFTTETATTDSDGDPLTVHRTQDFYFDDDGVLTHWTDAAFAERPGSEQSSIVVQHSKFEIDFLDDLPDEIKEYLAEVESESSKSDASRRAPLP